MLLDQLKKCTDKTNGIKVGQLLRLTLAKRTEDIESKPAKERPKVLLDTYPSLKVPENVSVLHYVYNFLGLL